MLDVLFLVGAFGVLLGVAGRPDAEVCVGGLELLDEFYGVVVVAVVSTLLDKLWGEVASEGHDVLDARGLHIGDALVDRLLATGHAGEVCQHRNVVFFFEVFCNVQSEVAYAATCAVGDAHEGGAEGRDGFGGGFDALEAGLLLGREHLEGEAHLVLLQDVDNFHVNLAGFKFVGRTGDLGLCKYFNTCINLDKVWRDGNREGVSMSENFSILGRELLT